MPSIHCRRGEVSRCDHNIVLPVIYGDLRALVCVNLLLSADQGERHDDISRRQILATQKLASIRRRGNLTVQEGEMRRVIIVQVHGVHTSSYGPGDRLNEKRHGSISNFCSCLSVWRSGQTKTPNSRSMNSPIKSNVMREPSA